MKAKDFSLIPLREENLPHNHYHYSSIPVAERRISASIRGGINCLLVWDLQRARDVVSPPRSSAMRGRWAQAVLEAMLWWDRSTRSTRMMLRRGVRLLPR